MSHPSSIRRFISCSSNYGRHGIGMHFAQLVEESRHAGELYGYAATQLRPGDERIGVVLPQPKKSIFNRLTRIVTTAGQFYEKACRHYEQNMSDGLPHGPNTLMAFAGRALQVSKRARELGYEQIELISPTSHISNVFKQHGKAQSISQIADSWLTETTRDRILQEYDEADYIYVHSDYTKQSFLDAGTHPDKIRTTKLVPNPRFIPPSSEIEKSAFRIVYVGRIDSSKGIHLLINAFKQIQNRNAELRIMGGWTSRAMKKYIQGEIRSDPRITVGPGDPLPILHRANVLVHPSFEDGFGYAPLEALCCGVPVIVTEDTGMKEFVVSGDNGFIVPSGEVQPIVDCLNTIDRQQLSFDAVKFRSQFYAE